MRRTGSARRGEAGQVAPFVLVVMALVALVLLGLVRLGEAAADRAQARAAADAAALAGAAEGRAAAERLATRNGARLVSFRSVGSDVIVSVVVGTMRATARGRAGAGAVELPIGPFDKPARTLRTRVARPPRPRHAGRAVGAP